MRQMSQQGVHVQAKKSLFDFHPTGVMDRDVAKVDAALKKAIAAAKAKGFDPEVELPPQQYAAHMRRWIDGYFKKLARHPTYVEAVDGCNHEEQTNLTGMRASWKALAQDLEADWDSPLLFPDKAPKELLAALPPTVVISAEFDMFITET